MGGFFMENKFTPIEYTGSIQQESSSYTDQNVRQPIEFDVFDAQAVNKESEVLPTMTFKEWKEKGFEAEVGTIITDVRPASLYTPQDWLDETKMGRAMNAQYEGDAEDAFIVKGIAYNHPKQHMGKVPVILEGNHRAVNAAFNGNRVSFEVVDHELPEQAQVWKVKNLLNRFGGMVR